MYRIQNCYFINKSGDELLINFGILTLCSFRRVNVINIQSVCVNEIVTALKSNQNICTYFFGQEFLHLSFNNVTLLSLYLTLFKIIIFNLDRAHYRQKLGSTFITHPHDFCLSKMRDPTINDLLFFQGRSNSILACYL